MPALFTILLPITRSPHFLPFAVESVAGQSIGDFELLIVCDGAPPETVAAAEAFARRDPRIKALAFPKGARHGEAHRHAALSQAAGRHVAHIADDDLWLPNHLEEMALLLSAADFGNTPHVSIQPGGQVDLWPGDLGRPALRQRMLKGSYNLFGLSFAGYRLEAYRRLAEGWSPAPAGMPSDLHMWRKFIRNAGMTFATRAVVTALQFASPARRDWPVERRREEIRSYAARLSEPRERDALIEAAWHSQLDLAARAHAPIYRLQTFQKSLRRLLRPKAG
jgi:glycosyltransferase involved in cell wall biosynthesis